MAAITDYAAYLAALSGSPQYVPMTCNAITTTSGRTHDLWTTGNVPAGVAPTTAVVPTNTTAGSLGQQDSGSKTLSIIGANYTAYDQGTLIICDRLSHQGGLSGTTTGAQTTNLPTAALTRYTSGVGVMAMISIYTTIGSTATTVTCSYTNTAAASGKTSPLVVIGGTGFNAVGRAIILPLASGDLGVTAVASVTLAASTLTAGNLGVTLFKPLYALSFNGWSDPAVVNLINGFSAGGIPTVVSGACLFGILIPRTTTGSGSGNLIIGEF